MSLKSLKVGFQVKVIAGKCKGQTGVIKKIAGDRVFVTGVNMLKKAVKPNPEKQEQGGHKSIEGSIHRSNVQLYDTKTQKVFKFGVKKNDDGKRVRFNKVSGDVIDSKEVKK